MFKQIQRIDILTNSWLGGNYTKLKMNNMRTRANLENLPCLVSDNKYK